MGSSPVRVTSKILKRTQFALGFLLFGARMGMVKNTSVRARSDSDDAFRGAPLGVSEFPAKRFDLGGLKLTKNNG